MTNAFATFWACLASMFSALNSTAKTFENVAQTAEEASEKFKLTNRLENQASLRDLREQLNITDDATTS